MTKKHEAAMLRVEAAIQEAIDQAIAVANKYNLTFEIGPARGTGATYYSPGFLKKELEEYTEQGNPKWATVNEYDYAVSLETGGWVSSSMEC